MKTSDRLEAVAARLSRAGLPANAIDAIDEAAISAEKLSAAYLGTLRPGTLVKFHTPESAYNPLPTWYLLVSRNKRGTWKAVEVDENTMKRSVKTKFTNVDVKNMPALSVSRREELKAHNPRILEALESKAGLAVSSSVVSAEKLSDQEGKKMEKAARKNKRVKKVWVEVTTQPEKKGKAWVGRATFEYKSGEKKGKKQSVNISLPGPAKLSIKSKKVWVKPKEGDAYFYAEESEAGGKDADEAAKSPEEMAKSGELAPPMKDADDDGVDDSARVGVPSRAVPVPPTIPRLPNLTDEERAIESRFADEFEKDPAKMTKAYSDAVIAQAKAEGGPPKFVTDDTKVLSPDYSSDKPIEEMSDDERGELGAKRARNNTMLHQTANAIAKRAFVEYLDELAKLPEGDPKRSVLVTSGGCGSGKGFSIKNNPEAKAMQANIGAVWDAAGEQNATENPWILDECKKRGLKANFIFVDADPERQWSHDKIGVMSRAKNAPPEGEGRMVDARLMADSYALGAKNFKAFYDKNKEDKNANFMFINTWKTSDAGFPVIEAGEGVDERSLKIKADDLYKKLIPEAEAKSPTEAIKEGATKGKRIWGDEGAAASASTKALSVAQWLSAAGFVRAEEEEAEEVEVDENVEAAKDEADEAMAKALHMELIANLAYNQQNTKEFYADKAKTHDAILAASKGKPESKDEPSEEGEGMSEEGMQGLHARIDAVAERLSALALPSTTLLAVEEAATAVSEVHAASDLSLHIAAEVDEMMGEAYRKLHTLKFEMDKFEEIPNYLKDFYDEVRAAANAIGKARTGRKGSTGQVREMAKRIARQVHGS